VEEAIPHGVSHSSSKRPTGRIVQRQFSGILHLGETFSLTGTLPCSSRCRAASLKEKPRATAPKLIPSIFVHLWLTHVPESLSRTRQPQGTNLHGQPTTTILLVTVASLPLAQNRGSRKQNFQLSPASPQHEAGEAGASTISATLQTCQGSCSPSQGHSWCQLGDWSLTGLMWNAQRVTGLTAGTPGVACGGLEGLV